MSQLPYGLYGPDPEPGTGPRPYAALPPDQQLPPGWPAPAWGPAGGNAPPAPPPPVMPTAPATYLQLLRGPRRRWWRPLVSLLLLVALGVPLSILALVTTLLYGLLGGVDDLGRYLDTVFTDGDLSPGSYLGLNLSLAILIPAVGLATWAVHQVRPGFVSSVAGRIRWRWLLRCAIVVTPLWLAYLVLSVIVAPPESGRPDQWVVLLVMSVVLTPFQAAGEEYLFRGWLAQNIAAWVPGPLASLLVTVPVSAALFAAAHGSLDPWVLADLAIFSVAASVMTWRTGGLEAAIALHTVNNVGLSLVLLTLGGWEESFVSTDTTGTPGTVLISLAVQSIAVALVWWQARRTNLDRYYRPPDQFARPARP